jgi:integration host factor subunit beta
MLKRDLVQGLQEAFPQHLKKDLGTVVDEVFSTVTTALQQGRRVEIRGIGSFVLHQQKARSFINPKTGKQTQCPPSFRVIFKPGKDLRLGQDRPARGRNGKHSDSVPHI